MTSTRAATRAHTPAATWTARAFLAAFTLVLALIVLLPSDGHQVLGLVNTLASLASHTGIPYGIAFAVIEFGANIALFTPLGLLLPVALHSQTPATVWATIAAGAAISVLIELAQQGIPGRVSSPADVLANTVGTAVGVVLLLAVRNGARRRAR